MATVERKTVIRSDTAHDSGAGLLVAFLFLLIAGLIFFLWNEQPRRPAVGPMLEKHITIQTPGLAVRAPAVPDDAQPE